MPPKIQGKGRTVAEPSFAQNTLHAFTDKENRSVVTAIGMFAVGTMAEVQEGRSRWDVEQMARTKTNITMAISMHNC